jgi:hypothetical protein
VRRIVQSRRVRNDSSSAVDCVGQPQNVNPHKIPWQGKVDLLQIDLQRSRLPKSKQNGFLFAEGKTSLDDKSHGHLAHSTDTKDPIERQDQRQVLARVDEMLGTTSMGNSSLLNGLD